MNETKPLPFKITIDDGTADGRYVNFANILHNPTEFFIDFGRVVPGRPEVKILSRIVTTPYHAKQFLKALQQNVELYERHFGPIREFAPAGIPETPGTETN